MDEKVREAIKNAVKKETFAQALAYQTGKPIPFL